MGKHCFVHSSRTAPFSCEEQWMALNPIHWLKVEKTVKGSCHCDLSDRVCLVDIHCNSLKYYVIKAHVHPSSVEHDVYGTLTGTKVKVIVTSGSSS